MNDHIRRDHEDLLESLIGGKLPRNLSWNAVVDLIGQIGEVQPHGNDEFAFIVGSQRGFFKRPSSHNLEVGDTNYNQQADVMTAIQFMRAKAPWRDL